MILEVENMNLMISSKLQRLYAIHVSLEKHQNLAYNDKDFSSKTVIPTLPLIYHTFGPVYPGKVINNEYFLNYPGISFTFPVSREDLDFIVEGSLPLNCKNLLVCSSCIVYSGEDLENPQIPTDVVSSHFLPLQRIGNHAPKLFRVKINLFKSVHRIAKFSFCNDPNVDKIVSIGISTPQDVLSDIGSPCRIYYKEMDYMKIHSPSACQKQCDYFFNYNHYGFDILFDGFLHLVKKIYLHTNPPGHFNFGKYSKCRFIIGENDDDIITDNSSWSEVIEILGPPSPEMKPVLFEPLDDSSDRNPFGLTEWRGYSTYKLIFEVLSLILMLGNEK
jgi:hypothetical protein